MLHTEGSTEYLCEYLDGSAADLDGEEQSQNTDKVFLLGKLSGLTFRALSIFPTVNFRVILISKNGERNTSHYNPMGESPAT